MTIILDWKDGWLCVKVTTIMSSKPAILHLWYPLSRMTENHAKDWYAVGSPLKEWVDGVYEYSGENSILWPNVKLHLTDGGRTKPIFSEEEPIPCPKVKTGIQTRWNIYQQRWEKLLKKGWFPA